MYKSLWTLFFLGLVLTQDLDVATTNVPIEKQDTSCITWDNEPGKCVPFSLCTDDTHSELIDIHYPYNPCPSFEDTCCKMPLAPAQEERRKGCGWTNPVGLNFSLETKTRYAEFPWVVAILNIESGETKGKYIGSGSLIDRRVVLTTALHLVGDTKNLLIRAGEWDTQTTKELYPHQDRKVESIVVHKDFSKALFYDVAVLFLAEPVDLAPNVGVACLPPPGETAEPDTRCYSTGWGKDTFGKENIINAILGKVVLPVVAHTECRDRLRKTRLRDLFELHHTFMCAGGEMGTNGCRADGGSPLVCPMEFQKDRYVQSGMVSWGIGCGEDGTPTVFVDVSKVRNWIDNEVLGKGIENLEYAKY